jgi:hypothetical protein
MLSEKQIEDLNRLDTIQLLFNSIDSLLSKEKEKYEKQYPCEPANISFLDFLNNQWVLFTDEYAIQESLRNNDIPKDDYTEVYFRTCKDTDMSHNAVIGRINGEFHFWTGNARVKTDSLKLAKLILFRELKPYSEERKRSVRVIGKLMDLQKSAFSMFDEYNSSTEHSKAIYLNDFLKKINGWIDKQCELLT